MLTNLLIAVLAAVGICSGAPLEAQASLSSVALESALLDTQLAYQSVGDHVVFLGPNGPKGLAHATIADYGNTVDGASALPAKTGKAFTKAVQFALCNAQTTAILQVLETHALLRAYAAEFNADQRKKMIAIVKKDRKQQKAYAPAFAEYTPLCADSIAHNGRITDETMGVTVQIFEAV